MLSKSRHTLSFVRNAPTVSRYLVTCTSQTQHESNHAALLSVQVVRRQDPPSCVSINRFGRSYSSSTVICGTEATSASSVKIDTFVANASINNHTGPSMTSQSGEECYQRAMDLLQQDVDLKQEKEETFAQQQYQAMQKAMTDNSTKNNSQTQTNASNSQNMSPNGNESSRANQKSNRRAGVAVVKTIVKQSRKTRDSTINANGNSALGSDTTSKQTSQNLQEEARRYMIVAALVHGYGKALVRLGNEALEHSKSKSVDDMDPYNYDFLDMDQEEGTSTARIEKIKAMNSYVERAQYFYEWAGEGGSPEGYFNLGHMLWMEAKPNVSQAMVAFQNAVELQDADAMYFVGVQFINCCEEDSPLQCIDGEYGIDQETRQRGLALIQRAAESYDHGGAWYFLTVFHRNGDTDLNIIPCSDDDFKNNLDQASSAEDADGLFLRGHCYYHGEDGYDQNYSRAFDDFLKSGEAGNPDGYVSAAAMLHRGGFGKVTKNQRRAFELYQEAAEMGSEDGWKNVIACYALGEGVPKCENTAKHIAQIMLKQE